jgi:hypothetical protein
MMLLHPQENNQPLERLRRQFDKTEAKVDTYKAIDTGKKGVRMDEETIKTTKP